MVKFGLSGEEAQISKEKFGDNRLSERERKTFWANLLENFGDPMIRILCAALLINVALVAASYLGLIPDKMTWYEPAGIAMAIILATFVSTFSEYRNENAFRRLQEEASRIRCKVYRDGAIREMAIDDIVQGDAVLLQTGDKIPADGVLISGELKADQAVLNGESGEALKTGAPEGWRDEAEAPDFLHPHKVFRGAMAVSGSAVMRVLAAGDKSVYGGIAKELQEDDGRDTPLKVKLSSLAKNISRFGYIGGVIIALALLFQRAAIANNFNMEQIAAYASNWTQVLNDVVHAVMLAVIIIVMAVPEGLPLMIAIVSALNMGKMLKDSVLVRKLAGIETAGSLNFLFCDKTGTITKGKLEVVLFGDAFGTEYKSLGDVGAGLRECLARSILYNSTAIMSGSGAERRAVGGNGTERALLNYADSFAGLSEPRDLVTVPFSSHYKFSAKTVQEGPQHKPVTFVKGAPENILGLCRSAFDKDGIIAPVASFDSLNKKIDDLAERSIRVLALARCDETIIKPDGNLDGLLPRDAEWALVGIIGIRDDVRPESARAIAEVRNAGVQVVMITGDRRETAVAIAREAGLFEGGRDIVITSGELAALSDAELARKMRDIKVVARALPSDKSRLVKAAQDLGFVVGMTGDGVNDSSALKKADVGFAMGSGTEVAKEASEIVILDDNFNSIDKAILYGRTIFNSIRKFLIFQLTINVSAVAVSFIVPLLGRKNPLTITQILWVNLVMDTLAALAFGGEPALGRFMKEAPKRRDEPIVNPAMRASIIVGGLWTFALSMAFLFTRFARNRFPSAPLDKLHTGYFAFFVLTAVFNAFNARTEKINLFDNIGGNAGFLRVLGIIVLVQVFLIHFGGRAFGGYGLSGLQWVIVILFSISIIPADIIRKAFAGMRKREEKSFTTNKRE
jgi:calcium-translocating P-type ATPase